MGALPVFAYGVVAWVEQGVAAWPRLLHGSVGALPAGLTSSVFFLFLVFVLLFSFSVAFGCSHYQAHILREELAPKNIKVTCIQVRFRESMLEGGEERERALGRL